MHKVMIDSKKYKVLIRRFVHEKYGKLFTYKEFIHWVTDRQYLIVSQCGNASLGQAIFMSILNHEFELDTNYRYSKDGLLETVFRIEKDKGRYARKFSETVPEISSYSKDEGGLNSEFYYQ